MNTVDQIRHLFEYDFWANRKILQSVTATDPRSERMLDIFSHILGAQQLWLQRITGGEYGPQMVWPALTLGESQDTLHQNEELWMSYLQSLTQDGLAKLISYTTSKGHSFENTVHDILTQVIMHGTYHRAQIAILMRQMDVQPPATDYIVYVRQG